MALAARRRVARHRATVPIDTTSAKAAPATASHTQWRDSHGVVTRTAWEAIVEDPARTSTAYVPGARPRRSVSAGLDGVHWSATVDKPGWRVVI